MNALFPILLLLGLSAQGFASPGMGQIKPSPPPVVVHQGASPVIEISKIAGSWQKQNLNIAAKPLQPGHLLSSPHATPVTAYVRALSSSAQNCRLPGAIAADTWRERWRMSVPYPPAAILTDGNAIVAQYGSGWMTMDVNGQKRGEGQNGRSAITLDSGLSLFYLVTSSSYLQAVAVQDGLLRFRYPLGFTENYAWPVMHRHGSRLLLAAMEQAVFSHERYPATESLIQLIEMKPTQEIDQHQMLRSISAYHSIHFSSPKMIPVMFGDTVFAVFSNLIVVLDSALAVKGAYSGDFEPVFASLDETGLLHLIVRNNAAYQVWLVDASGRLVANISIGLQYEAVAGPPAIGYDHRFYLWTSQSVGAWSAEGRHLWDRTLAGGIIGVGVTTDDRLIVAAGSKLFLLDGSGESTELHQFDEAITTAPVVTATGEILVGTTTTVRCLAPKN